MIRDSEFSEEIISDFIMSDSIDRNTYLNTFIGALNSIAKNTYISIDANWGAGKTVFMKQLEYLNYCPLDNFSAPNINTEKVKTFHNKYVVFYYNAWENDYYNDALQSLLFNLINKFYANNVGQKYKDKVKVIASSALESLVNEKIRSLTGGIIDIEKIRKNTSIETLIANIRTVDKRKKAVSEIIDNILSEGKKLLFIIDELDRCNPEFAINLIEVAKHYYDNDRVVFLFSTNNRQLVNTVKKHYGNDFDGYSYLDKLYDLLLELPPIDIEKYIHTQLDVPNNYIPENTIPAKIAKQLDMTMREINRYHTALSFIKSDEMYIDDALTITNFAFMPLALALKIKDIKLYDSFISGNGEDFIKNLYTKDEAIFSDAISDRIVEDGSTDLTRSLELYKKIIAPRNILHERPSHDIDIARNLFKNFLPMISSVKIIDTSK